jgi:proteasome lid subunit RPN8/RPN11
VSSAKQPRLAFNRSLWDGLIAELADRGQGRRESGAFLLGRVDGELTRLVDAIYYDDLDPHCLTGGISLASWAYGPLWQICEQIGLGVVADVHTHPGSSVGQSSIDRAHPMISMAGHVALIIPNFARGVITPRDVGVHDYLGEGRWKSHHGDDAAERFLVHDDKPQRWWQRWRSLFHA